MLVVHRARRGRRALIVAAAGAWALALSFTASSLGQTGGAMAPSSYDGSTTTTTSPPSTARKQRATWYGPGFWGNRTACGQRLRKKTIGVAHKRLPCGTKVTFYHRGRKQTARVIDRGPYVRGYKWDLTRKLAKRLDFIAKGKGYVRAAVRR